MEFLNSNCISALIGAVVGGIITFIVQFLAIRNENKSTQLQNFQNAFFQLLNLQQQILEGLRDKQKPHIQGRDCFEYWYFFLKEHYETNRQHELLPETLGYTSSTAKDRGGERDLKLIQSVYLEFYQERQAYLGHYFRNLYHVFKLIETERVLTKGDSASGDSQRKYASIARAQLSQFELALLFYHSLTPKPPETAKNFRRKFQKLIEKYGLLENFNSDLLPEKEHRRFYKTSAFGDSIGAVSSHDHMPAKPTG